MMASKSLPTVPSLYLLVVCLSDAVAAAARYNRHCRCRCLPCNNRASHANSSATHPKTRPPRLLLPLQLLKHRSVRVAIPGLLLFSRALLAAATATAGIRTRLEADCTGAQAQAERIIRHSCVDDGAPGEEEGLPDVVILGAYNPVFCAKIGDVLTAVPKDSVGYGVIFAQVNVLPLTLHLQRIIAAESSPHYRVQKGHKA